ncbi:MAG: Mur ligase domain-containing protein [Victivallales bacterium]|nr:Mur ligase domain-containing protein [Victivallales bacterium]
MADDHTFAAGAALHFIGIGGIGMSGLAQMCRALGCRVSGSDRALDNPENRRIFTALRAQGITLYPQDGSGVRTARPDYLIYSTAIEEDNPDFAAAAADVTRLHRSAALAMAMRQQHDLTMIAVTGSCGKTTVSAWLAETLDRMGHAPSFLTGGLANSYIAPARAGNYRRGHGRYFVFEADESDKSLLAYHPDFTVILNIGTDHYSKEELIRVFQQFLRQTTIGAVVEQSVAAALGPECMAHLQVTLFDARENGGGADTAGFRDFCSDANGFSAAFAGAGRLSLPLPGVHNAANALTVLCSLRMLGLPSAGIDTALSAFGGVWRRFDYAGTLPSGAAVYDDYAHNVEKIVSCIRGARSINGGRVVALFQPHGFKPLQFMREELLRQLEKQLEKDDIFGLLPVYYAGGTAAFSPTSEEVAATFRDRGSKSYRYWPSRADAAQALQRLTGKGDVVLIMGARDNSLSDWAKEITCTGK